MRDKIREIERLWKDCIEDEILFSPSTSYSKISIVQLIQWSIVLSIAVRIIQKLRFYWGSKRGHSGSNFHKDIQGERKRGTWILYIQLYNASGCTVKFRQRNFLYSDIVVYSRLHHKVGCRVSNLERDQRREGVIGNSKEWKGH